MPKPKKEPRPQREDYKARILFSDFEVGLPRAVLDTNPRHPRALEMLGQALTRVGRHNEALEADLRITSIRPKVPVAFYNPACSYSKLQNLDAAFAALSSVFHMCNRDTSIITR